MAEANQQFDDFTQWKHKASSWLTRHEDYNNTEHGEDGYRGPHFTAMCFDTQGRRCREGGDFMRARDENTFPIRWIWPDQVWRLAATPERREFNRWFVKTYADADGRFTHLPSWFKSDMWNAWQASRNSHRG